ncbi:MAG: hypothetical protein JJT94_08120 [Bernardetiaceae bacterium]|nr:hypothetical protein [Bernardetiaceae bacterium]
MAWLEKLTAPQTQLMLDTLESDKKTIFKLTLMRLVHAGFVRIQKSEETLLLSRGPHFEKAPQNLPANEQAMLEQIKKNEYITISLFIEALATNYRSKTSLKQNILTKGNFQTWTKKKSAGLVYIALGVLLGIVVLVPALQINGGLRFFLGAVAIITLIMGLFYDNYTLNKKGYQIQQELKNELAVYRKEIEEIPDLSKRISYLNQKIGSNLFLILETADWLAELQQISLNEEKNRIDNNGTYIDADASDMLFWMYIYNADGVMTGNIFDMFEVGGMDMSTKLSDFSFDSLDFSGFDSSGSDGGGGGDAGCGGGGCGGCG